MSTINDFKNAPVGATATRETTGSRAMKMDDVQRRWATPNGVYLDNEEMEKRGFTLEPLEPAPATAWEALDLTWELAHEVKPGQHIPAGTRYVRRSQSGGLSTFTAVQGWTPAPRWTEHVRTLDPLPEPEPDWLDAPAVMASLDDMTRWDLDERQVFTPASEGEGHWVAMFSALTYHSSDLRDVTPLYPKGQNACVTTRQSLRS